MLQWNWPLGSRDNVDILLLRATRLSMSLCIDIGRGCTHPIQSANSLVFGTVADKRMILTWSGSIMMTSSHTTPLYSRRNFFFKKKSKNGQQLPHTSASFT